MATMIILAQSLCELIFGSPKYAIEGTVATVTAQGIHYVVFGVLCLFF